MKRLFLVQARWCFSFFIIFSFIEGVGGQTVLLPGDVALLTLNADGQKNFDFVSFVHIEEGTVIHFTDDAWIAGETNSFFGSEGILTFTAENNINAGSIISCPGKDGGEGFVESGSFNPSASGDNILIYQGDQQNPVFIFGAGWGRGSTVWEYSLVSSLNRSDIPPGLGYNNYTISSLGTSDNYQYNIDNGISGKQVEILLKLIESSNYSSDNYEAFQAMLTQFTVQNAVSICTGSQVSWTNAQWTNGLPDETTDIIFDGDIIIDTDLICHDMKISGGGKIEVLPGITMRVNRNIQNDQGTDGLVINSGPDASGSLFYSGNQISGTYKLYIGENQWHFISSPVDEDLLADNILGTTQGDLYGAYKYDVLQNLWISASGGNLSKGTGYNVYYENQAKIASFSGEFNSYKQYEYIQLNKSGNNGWNLIGNPFPSTLDWGLAQDTDPDGWIKQNQLVENKTIYITTGGTGSNTSFAVYNGNSGIGIPDNDVRYIAPGQGFWVNALETGNLGISNNARSTSKAGFKNQDSQINTFRIIIDNNNFSDQTVVCYLRNAIQEYGIYDSEKKINSQNQGVQIYSILPDKRLAINALPDYISVYSIKLGYYSSAGMLLKINILQNNDQETQYKIELEDSYKNIKTELKDNNYYSFYTDSGTFENRFLLHIMPVNIIDNIRQNNTQPPKIIFKHNVLSIKMEKKAECELAVFDILGRIIMKDKIIGPCEKMYNLHNTPGIYFVKLNLGNSQVVRKVYLE
ncbi:T9SS type A sorting domain-containing protein [Bacteroidota bacterium]